MSPPPQSPRFELFQNLPLRGPLHQAARIGFTLCCRSFFALLIENFAVDHMVLVRFICLCSVLLGLSCFYPLGMAAFTCLSVPLIDRWAPRTRTRTVSTRLPFGHAVVPPERGHVNLVSIDAKRTLPPPRFHPHGLHHTRTQTTKHRRPHHHHNAPRSQPHAPAPRPRGRPAGCVRPA